MLVMAGSGYLLLAALHALAAFAQKIVKHYIRVQMTLQIKQLVPEDEEDEGIDNLADRLFYDDDLLN